MTRLRIALALAATLVLIVTGAAFAVMPVAHADTTYEQTDLTWTPARNMVTDTGASGGTSVQLNGNTAGVLTVPGALSGVTVRARGQECWQGQWPAMRVSVGTTVVGLVNVTTNAWGFYPFTVPAGVTGAVKVEMTNGFDGWAWFQLMCQRTLYVDTVTTVPLAPTTTTTTTPPTSTTTTPAPTSTTTTSPPPPAGGGEYVAMGDSYSSGAGADRSPAQPTRDNSVYAGNSCGRSTYAAQVLIAAERGYTLINAACGGANTTNILTTGMNGEPAQITRLTPATKLVTMTIGGNDTAIIWMLTQCITAQPDCTPGNTAGWFFAPASYYAQTYQKIDAVQPQLEAILRQVATRSPDATVIMAGYPYIIPPPGDSVGTCADGITAGEQVAFADLITRTNAKIKAAVQVVAAETGKDYRFADPLAPASPFMERFSPGNQLGDACSTASQRWMNKDAQADSWHPNIYGQRRYADLYEAVLG